MTREILQWVVPGIVMMLIVPVFAWWRQKPSNQECKLALHEMITIYFGFYVLATIAIFLVLGAIHFLIWLY